MGSSRLVRAEKDDVQEGCWVAEEGKLMFFVPESGELKIKRKGHYVGKLYSIQGVSR